MDRLAECCYFWETLQYFLPILCWTLVNLVDYCSQLVRIIDDVKEMITPLLVLLIDFAVVKALKIVTKCLTVDYYCQIQMICESLASGEQNCSFVFSWITHASRCILVVCSCAVENAKELEQSWELGCPLSRELNYDNEPFDSYLSRRDLAKLP